MRSYSRWFAHAVGYFFELAFVVGGVTSFYEEVLTDIFPLNHHESWEDGGHLTSLTGRDHGLLKQRPPKRM